ncbi:tyrosine-protein phosphatase [Erwinia sp. HR93]|uniref:tyrosine-protein phosphatase n=1 Tax=Erwinia sp. HR93 TaxID=3094840 RepID=UPI002ADEE31B|nr:tyrosine-protein phosphatase [Erwinia sp. HR93]MEA1063245.1 tyrosine-protein phosphatase [Erwinia sp. HR93]
MDELITPRPLTLEGVNNVRDMGGYPVAGGHLRSGKLLRGEDLYAITPEGVNVLAQIPVTKVVDLRTRAEVDERPDYSPEGAPIVHLDVLRNVLKEHSASPKEMVARLQGHSPAQILQDIYLDFVQESGCLDAWRGFFQALLTLEQGALYFHCSAGKDRTGFAAALVLMALGADREVIMADYLLSNRYREAINQRLLAQFSALAPEKKPEDILTLLEVQESYLRASFQALDKLYGNSDAFLQQALGIGPDERAQLRALLVVS